MQNTLNQFLLITMIQIQFNFMMIMGLTMVS